jgi:gamma-glutamyltranspeptidase/glutathione hydrolase
VSCRTASGSLARRSEVYAKHGMAATSQPLATQAAVDCLRRGGNAIDAAIAANAVLALTEPTGCGLGGDLFALVWSAKERRLFGLNGSGRSPRALTFETLRRLAGERVPPGIPKYGPLPITVPGCVDGWFTLHARFGRLPMSEILAPAIRLAREGFPVTEVIAEAWRRNGELLQGQPGFDELYLPGGHAPRAGEVFRNPGLARTLERIAAGGRDVFYAGEIAGEIADFVQANGGFLAREDLAGHRSEWVEPLSTSYRGYDVWELPPNGQGITALQILNLLEGFDLASVSFGSAEHLHLLIEAKKVAFADQARYVADPTFAALPLEGLLSKAYAAERRELIDREHAALAVAPGDPRLFEGDTVCLSTADAEGNLVSLIQSNFRGMGSGLAPANLGFVLQDRGELFDLEPGRPNSYAPEKRPFHTIIPGFVTKDGKPWLSFGVMGGDFQPQGHAQVLVNLIDFHMGLQEAGDAPRVAHTGPYEALGETLAGGGVVSLESGFDPTVVEELRRRGHRIEERRGIYGGYQAIRVDPKTGVLAGASESRKDGCALGY